MPDKQLDMKMPCNGEEFAKFILVAANQCDLAPEEFFVAISNALAAGAYTWTEGQEEALTVTRLSCEHALLCVRGAYQRPANSMVMQ